MCIPPPVCCIHLRVYSLPTPIIFPNRCVDSSGSIRDLVDQVADTVDNIEIIESCPMSTSIDGGFRLHQVVHKCGRNVKVLSYGIGGAE